VRWINGLSVFLWALSAVFFIFSHIFSAQETGEVTAIGSNGERILLDTLLDGQQIGLVTGGSVLHNQASDTVSHVLPAPQTPCIAINSAAEAQLILINGVGPALAANIIRRREENGKFRKKEDLLKVKGIGAAKMERIAQQVCF
jgi:competence protein ComEA